MYVPFSSILYHLVWENLQIQRNLAKNLSQVEDWRRLEVGVDMSGHEWTGPLPLWAMGDLQVTENMMKDEAEA